MLRQTSLEGSRTALEGLSPNHHFGGASFQGDGLSWKVCRWDLGVERARLLLPCLKDCGNTSSPVFFFNPAVFLPIVGMQRLLTSGVVEQRK